MFLATKYMLICYSHHRDTPSISKGFLCSVNKGIEFITGQALTLKSHDTINLKTSHANLFLGLVLGNLWGPAELISCNSQGLLWIYCSGFHSIGVIKKRNMTTSQKSHKIRVWKNSIPCRQPNSELSPFLPWDVGLYCPVSTRGREAADSGLVGREGNGFFPRIESKKKANNQCRAGELHLII